MEWREEMEGKHQCHGGVLVDFEFRHLRVETNIPIVREEVLANARVQHLVRRPATTLLRVCWKVCSPPVHLRLETSHKALRPGSEKGPTKGTPQLQE